jgi:hypothetical protein
VLIVSCFSINAYNVPQDSFQEGEHKEMHTHENFENYGVLETNISSLSI